MSVVCVISQAQTLMAVNGDAFSMSAFTGRSNGTNWAEFCEHHATVAAEDFSLHVTQFLQDNVAGDRQLTRRDFVSKFVDCFQRHFDSTQVRHHILNKAVKVTHWRINCDFKKSMPLKILFPKKIMTLLDNKWTKKLKNSVIVNVCKLVTCSHKKKSKNVTKCAFKPRLIVRLTRLKKLIAWRTYTFTCTYCRAELVSLLFSANPPKRGP